MNQHFIILSSGIDTFRPKLSSIKTSSGYCFYFSPNSRIAHLSDLSIYIKGYIIPRNDIYEQYKFIDSYVMVNFLYNNFGDNFVNYIKGSFVIIIFSSHNIKLFTDQFGFKFCFYFMDNVISAISSSISLLKAAGFRLVFDKVSLATKSILHRNIPGYTVYKGVFQTTPASFIKLDIHKSVIENYWHCSALLKDLPISSKPQGFLPYAELFKTNFTNFQDYLKPESHAITLTGGKDSRTGLAALMSLGITPHGFTYGNKNSRDAVFAATLSQDLGISHHVFEPPASREWFDKIADDIIGFGNSEISIHRAHRLNAFSKMAEITDSPSAYYAGYMAGEFLMGVYYDGLIFTQFLINSWESSQKQPLKPILYNCFHRPGSIHMDDIIHRISKLKCFDSNLSKGEKQLHSMFEIGIPHHGQDIFLSEHFFDYVYPFFIDLDFLTALFKSPYSFFFVDNNSINLFKRYNLFQFNLNVQHILSPEMDHIPFGKRGFYSTTDFLRGKFYWATVKTARFILQKQKYPASFSYSTSYRDFILTNFQSLIEDLHSELHDIYDVTKAISELKSTNFPSAERPLHKFSNIVMLHRQKKHYGRN